MRLTARTRNELVTAMAFLAGASLVLPRAARGADAPYSVRTFQLPDAGTAAISMDYIAYDPATGSVWVPAGNTGAVDVINTAAGTVRRIAGFKTAEIGTGDRKRTVGPSSVTVGQGSVYVGNRGDSSVCRFDARTLAAGACRRLDSMPDGLAYVAATREVWVTTPRDKSIRVLDDDKLEQKARLEFDGNPEGFAVDAKRERFYTNLEDKDQTLSIDVKSRKTLATWNSSCGQEGPRGLRVDAETGQLFVACTARVEVLDAAHDGKVLSSLETGDGVDDIDYSPATHLLYVGAARAGRLTIARVSADGKLTEMGTVPTRVGSRNPAVTKEGAVYLAHSGQGGASKDLVVVEPRKGPAR
jgi:DNA-binding beta-propeller fold protein YncE